MMADDPYGARAPLSGGGPDLIRLERLSELGVGDLSRLPHTVKILLENLLRHAGGQHVTEQDIEALASYPAHAPSGTSVPFQPARVVLQDFTGVPAVVDLAMMRAAMARAGGDAARVDPLVPCDLVIDHSVQVDSTSATRLLAYERNIRAREFKRNRERYAVPPLGPGRIRQLQAPCLPNTGIVPPGQPRVPRARDRGAARRTGASRSRTRSLAPTRTRRWSTASAYFGWGVGGIEAEAVNAGRADLDARCAPGRRRSGFSRRAQPEACDGDRPRPHAVVQTPAPGRGVVGSFVEYFGHGVTSALRSRTARRSGTCPPSTAPRLRLLPGRRGDAPLTSASTGRGDDHVELVDRVLPRRTGLFRHDPDEQPTYDADRGARPLHRRAVDRRTAKAAGPDPPPRGSRNAFSAALPSFELSTEGNGQVEEAGEESMDGSDAATLTANATRSAVELKMNGETVEIDHGAVVIAAITSCTNTSNPAVMIGAGLLAKQGRSSSGLTHADPG